MSRHLVAALVLLLAGCSTSGTPQATKPSSSSSSGTPMTVTPSPVQSGNHSPEPSGAPVVKVGFSCRLPVITFRTGGDAVTYQGGFINFPSASYADDPHGLIYNPYQQPVITTRETPVLNGVLSEGTSPFFDAARSRWVPSGPGQASSDGASYAYATSTDSSNVLIHVVDVARGTEKTFHIAVPSNVGAANGIEVEDYDGAGVFFVVTQVEAYPVGVWRLDVATGKVTALSNVGNVLAVRGGFAWSGGVDPHDPSPPRVAASRELFDSITQVNLATGARTPWYYTPGRSEYLLGLASAGWPIVNISDAPDYPPYGGEIRLVPEPHTDGESNGELVSNGQALINPQTDGDRTWFGSDNGIYLYTSAGGLQKVFAFPPEPTTARTMSPAGFCR